MILTQTAAESAGIFGTLIGFGVLLIGASGVFGELQDSLNQIWGVSSKRHPVFILVKERVFSFAMVEAQAQSNVDTGGVLGISKARRRWEETQRDPLLILPLNPMTTE